MTIPVAAFDDFDDRDPEDIIQDDDSPAKTFVAFLPWEDFDYDDDDDFWDDDDLFEDDEDDDYFYDDDLDDPEY